MYRSSLFLAASASLLMFSGGCAGRGSGDVITGSGGSGSGSGSGSGGSGSGSGSGSGGNSSSSGSGGNSSSSGSGGNSSSSGSGGSDSSGSGGGANVTDGGVIIPPSTLAAPDPCQGGSTPGPRKLWRLSAPEFAASIHSIFGDTANAAPVATVFSDPTMLGFSVDANALLVQDLNASQLEDNAEAIAAWAASAGKLAQFASCASSTSGAPASSCATSFIQAFGKAAFRTTLASNDPRITSYSKLFMAGSSNSDGAQAVISAMLQSPYFLYRSELGKQSGSTFTLTPYEVASELAYTLTGTTPDSTLLSAADSVNSGSLTMASDDRPAGDRASPASSAASNSDGGDGLHERLARAAAPLHHRPRRDRLPDRVDGAERDADRVAGSDHGGLQRHRDLRLGADGRPLVLERRPRQLLRHHASGSAARRSQSVKYAGATTRDPGLLATGTILNGYARPDEDSPTQRGHMVRSRMLCQDISPPPPGLNTTFMPSTTVGDDARSLHQRARARAVRRLPQADGLDRLRLRELRRLGALPHHRQRPADRRHARRSTGDPEGNDDDVTGLSGSGSLSAYLAGSDDVTHCMQRYWTYYAYGSSSWAQDGCTYDAVYNEAQSNGFALKSMLMAIIHAPNFTTRVQDQ